MICVSSTGERAIRECIEDGRAIAEKCSGPERSTIMQLCDDLDLLTDEIASMMRMGMVIIIIIIIIVYSSLFTLLKHRGSLCSNF